MPTLSSAVKIGDRVEITKKGPFQGMRGVVKPALAGMVLVKLDIGREIGFSINQVKKI